jgi:hypothetical protein
MEVGKAVSEIVEWRRISQNSWEGVTGERKEGEGGGLRIPTHTTTLLSHLSPYLRPLKTYQCLAVRMSEGPTSVAVQYCLSGNSNLPIARPGQPWGSVKLLRSTHPYTFN